MFNKIVKNSKNFSLTKEEKQIILNKVSLYIKENPVGSFGGSIVSPYSIFVSYILKIKQKDFAYTGIATLLLIILGGGTAMAANLALPGDTLYPIKVNINENIKSTLAITAKADAKVEASKAHERLKEAEKLAVKGKLSVEAKTTIEEKFTKHAERVKELVLDIEASGDTKEASSINSNFEIGLTAHSSILGELSEGDSESQENVNDINATVSMYLNDVTKARSEGEDKMVSSSSNEDIQAQAEISLKDSSNKIIEVEKYIESNKDFTSEVKAQATTHINVAKESIEAGKIKMEAKAYGEAYILFQSAFRTAENANLILNSESKLKINIGEALNLNNNIEKEDTIKDIEKDDLSDLNYKSSEDSASIKSNSDVKVNTNYSDTSSGTKSLIN